LLLALTIAPAESGNVRNKRFSKILAVIFMINYQAIFEDL